MNITKESDHQRAESMDVVMARFCEGLKDGTIMDRQRFIAASGFAPSTTRSYANRPGMAGHYVVLDGRGWFGNKKTIAYVKENGL